MEIISRKEELMLLTIWKLGSHSYGVTIREHLTKVTGKFWSIGATYDILDRLTRKGLVTTEISEPLNERGGKRRKYYYVTKAGQAALEEAKELHATMWLDLPNTIAVKE